MCTNGRTMPSGRWCAWTRPARSCGRRLAAVCRRSPASRAPGLRVRRKGVCNLFMAIEPLRGRRKVRVTDRRTAQDFAEQLRVLVEEDYPDVDGIVLVTDNLNTHTPACLYERFRPDQARRIARKLEWHYTPEHGSWLNIAECELSVLARQCLDRRISDKSSLEQEAAAWETRRNAARVTVARLLDRILLSRQRPLPPVHMAGRHRRSFLFPGRSRWSGCRPASRLAHACPGDPAGHSAGLHLRQTLPVVFNDSDHSVSFPFQHHAHPLRFGMPHHVRQGLLHYPVEGGLYIGRQALAPRSPPIRGRP